MLQSKMEAIAAFLNAAGNDELGLSAGSVYGFCRKLAGNAESSMQNLEGELLNQGVVLTDATTVTVNGEQNYIRNFSIGKTVIYRAMKSKAIGHEMYCAILTIIETLKRRNMALIENIKKLFMGAPAIFLPVLRLVVQPEG